MARDPRILAMSRLKAKREKWERARRLAVTAREELDDAIRSARAAGLSATDIGHRVGVSRTRVMQVVTEGRSHSKEG